MTNRSEILFVDPSVSDLETILGHLRPGVEAIVLDSARPAERQIAAALAGRSELGVIHVIAHGAPGRVSFAAGDWSASTLEDAAEDFAAIGNALGKDGDIRLWSCYAGAGEEGDAFVAGLVAATGASVAAARGLVGAAALGGEWELEARSQCAVVRPPLTEAGVARYPGALDDYIEIDTGGAPVTLGSGAYSLVAKDNGRTKVIGHFAVIKGFAHDMLIKVVTGRSSYTVYAGPDGNIGDGQITLYDSLGKYSRTAALALLGADGATVRARSIASRPTRPLPTVPSRIGGKSRPQANSGKTRNSGRTL